MNFINSIAIYIPSAGRATSQPTLNHLPDAYRDVTYLVVPFKQKQEYAIHADKCAGVLAPPNVRGIGATRQWIFENTKAEYILMVDDDMYFFHRVAPRDYHLKANNKKHSKYMFDELFAYMIDDGYRHVGLGARTNASFHLCEYRVCQRVNNVHGFHVPTLRKHKIRFDALPLMEDFNVTLSLLTLGYKNKLLIDYVWNQSASNSKGGCSTYRTGELQAASAHALHKLWPQFVRVKVKKVTGKVSWMGLRERTDVQIDWHKAYLSSGRPEPKNWVRARNSTRK